eukprot:s16_g19.t1
MCSIFKQLSALFLRFLEMGPSLPGVLLQPVVTALLCKVSCRMCSRSKPQRGAFAAILGDGSVVTWGSDIDGADSSAVQDQLRNVRQIQSSPSSFAAILGDGSVVTWGEADHGGDSSAVQHQRKNVRQIQATVMAVAAILGDGSVVTWGDADHGGDSSAVQHQLRNVQQIQAAFLAFAAILADGSVDLGFCCIRW